MSETKRVRYSEAVIAMVRKAKNAREASRLTGVSHSYCKALRRDKWRSDSNPPPTRFSLVQSMIDLVEEMGRATVEDLVPLFPEHTPKQVASALHRAHFERRIAMVEIGKRIGRGSLPAVYGPVGGDVDPRVRGPRPSQLETDVDDDDDAPLVTRTCIRGDYGIPRVASVWELGAWG